MDTTFIFHKTLFASQKIVNFIVIDIIKLVFKETMWILKFALKE